MKINYKYTIAYTVITFVVLNIGFAIVYSAIRRGAVQSVAGKLENLNQIIARHMGQQSVPLDFVPGKNVKIKLFAVQDSLTNPESVKIQKEWSDEVEAIVPMVYFSSYPMVNGKQYTISSKAMLVEPDDIYLTGIILVFAWTFVFFLIALVILLSELISWHILKPFNDTLDAIQQFEIDQENTINIQETQTTEFRELNNFLVKMSGKAKNSYIALKEFSENASHELQTPIATMKAKIELLMESELEEMQAAMLSDIHDELEKLAKINHSLTLLAKLENYNSDLSSRIDLSAILSGKIIGFTDWMEMREINLEIAIEPQVTIALDESLAVLMLNNLISNSIRHNVPSGKIVIQLTSTELKIKNTGKAPGIPISELFGRFKKGNSERDSIGIGLAIVKKICELYGHQISYEYAGGWHSLTLVFNQISKVL
ncbi:sensor histidine kinase [Pedobacter sp. NJ-S-72]